MFSFTNCRGALGVIVSALLTCCIAGPAMGDELRYLPDGVTYVEFIDISAVRRSKTFALLSKTKVPFGDFEKELVSEFGMSADNVERFSVGAKLSTGNDAVGELPFVTVVTTTKPIVAADVEKARSKLESIRKKNIAFKRVKVGNFTVHREIYADNSGFPDREGAPKTPPTIEGEAFCVIENNVLVIGDWPSVQQILQRGKAAVPSANVQAGLKVAALTDPFVVVVDIEAMAAEAKQSLAESVAVVGADTALASAKTLAVWFGENGNLTVSAAMVLKDNASAIDAQKAIKAGLGGLRAKLGDLKISAVQSKGLAQVLDGIELRQLTNDRSMPDNKLIARLTVEPALFAMIAELINQ